MSLSLSHYLLYKDYTMFKKLTFHSSHEKNYFKEWSGILQNEIINECIGCLLIDSTFNFENHVLVWKVSYQNYKTID